MYTANHSLFRTSYITIEYQPPMLSYNLLEDARQGYAGSLWKP